MTIRKPAARTKQLAAKKKPTTAKPTQSSAKLAKAAKPVSKVAATPPKAAKPIKVKLIRDSFTMPSYDYDLIATLKNRALDNKTVLKKSELLRAGLHALSKLEAQQLIALVSTLAVVKTGRPKH
jgi:hypothetical protein